MNYTEHHFGIAPLLIAGAASALTHAFDFGTRIYSDQVTNTTIKDVKRNINYWNDQTSEAKNIYDAASFKIGAQNLKNILVFGGAGLALLIPFLILRSKRNA